MLLLLVLVNFYSPLFSFALVPLVKKFMGDYILHYPAYFIFLPKIFSRASLFLGGIFGIITVGWAIYLFFCYFLADRKIEIINGLKLTFSKYILLLGIWVLETIVLLGWFFFVSRVIGKGFLEGNLKKEIAFEIFSLGTGAVFYGFFAYSIPAIILSGKNIISSLVLSIMIFRRNFFSTYFFVFLPNLLTFPFSFLYRRAPLLLSKFNPEIVSLILVLQIGITMVANYILISVITRFYLYDQGLD